MHRFGPSVAWLSALLVGALAVLIPADGGAQEAFSIAPPPAWVEVLPAREEEPAGPAGRSGEGDAGGETEVLLVSLQDRVSEQGSASYFRFRYRVRGASSIQEDSQVEIGFNPAYEELILHTARVYREGREVNQLGPDRVQVYDQETELSNQIVGGWKTAVLFLEDVRPGDVVDYSYTLRGANPVLGGHYMRAFPLGFSGDVGRVHDRLLWERDRAPWFGVHGNGMKSRIPGVHAAEAGIEPQVREVGGATEYTWDLRDTEAVLVEPRTPVWYRPYPAVQVSDFASWAEVAEWGRDLFRVDAPIPGELARVVEEIRATHPDDRGRLEGALRFVQDEIRYLAVDIGQNSHRPYPPSVVIGRRYGDCKDKALVLITMLEELGLEAHPALVSTTYGEHVADFHPTADVFDHAIVQVRIGGEVFWVDPTELLDREPLTPNVSRYGAALVLDTGTDRLARIRPPEPSLPERDIKAGLKIGAPGEGTTMVVKTVYRHDWANDIRRYFESTPRDQVARGYLEFYAKLYPGIESVGALDLQDDEAANEVVVTERYRVPDFWYDPDKGGSLVGELYPLELASELPATASGQRSMPLAVDHPAWIRYVIEARFEEGWSIEPKEVDVATSALRFSYEAETVDDVLRLTYDYKTVADHVPPESAAEQLQGEKRIANLLTYSIRPPLTHGGAPDTGGINWLALVPLLALVGAATVGARRVVTLEGVTYPHHPAVPPGEPRGLGGLLILVGIHVFVIPISAVVNLQMTVVPVLDAAKWSLLTTPGSALHAPALASVFAIEGGLSLVVFIFGALLPWAFFKKKRIFPGLYVAVTLVAQVAAILDVVLGEAIGRDHASEFGAPGTRILVALIWITYMFRSRRVRNTFTE